MQDNNVFDQASSSSNNVQHFVRPVIAGIVGGYIGHRLDQTRFGIWVNTNRTITAVCHWLKIILVLAGVIGLLLYTYIFLTVPEVG